MSPVVHRSLALLLVVVSASGCARVIPPATEHIVPSEPTASFRERRESFLALRPEGLDMTHVIHYDRMFGRHERWVDALHLANGTQIYLPDALLTAIEPASPTALSIARYDRHRRQANRRLWISRGFAIGMLGSLVAAVAMRNDNAQVAAGLTSGSLFLGWVGTRWAHRIAIRRRNEAEYQAYLTYDADLAEHLRLCVGEDGETVRDCR